MAHEVFCPNCEKTTQCQKKGKTKSGKQKWLCKECNRTFTQATESNNNTQKTQDSNNNTVKTEIYLNNNIVSTVEAPLTPEQAEDVLKLYVSANITGKNIVNENGTIKIFFNADLGGKA